MEWLAVIMGGDERRAQSFMRRRRREVPDRRVGEWSRGHSKLDSVKKPTSNIACRMHALNIFYSSSSRHFTRHI